jgi:hypothetical protein
MKQQPIPKPKRLYIVPGSDRDKSAAEIIASALEVPVFQREDLSIDTDAALLLVALHERSILEFVSLRDEQPVGPAMHVRRLYRKPRGDWKRW